MMKADVLLDAIGMISDDFIRDAKQYTKSIKRHWVKWGAIAASFIFLVAIAISIPHISNFITKDSVEPLIVVEFNGAYYEIVDMNNAAILNEHNLPKKISDEMIGIYLGSAEIEGNENKKYEVYAYSGNVAQDNVQPILICKSANGKFAFMLFCNFIHSDAAFFEKADVLFTMFGISNLDNIATLEMDEVQIADMSVTKALYEGLLKADAMGSDSFQLAVFGGKLETEQQKLSKFLAENSIDIRLESESGQVSYMVYYPTIKYVYWCQNYYKLSDDVCELINNQ